VSTAFSFDTLSNVWMMNVEEPLQRLGEADARLDVIGLSPGTIERKPMSLPGMPRQLVVQRHGRRDERPRARVVHQDQERERLREVELLLQRHQVVGRRMPHAEPGVVTYCRMTTFLNAGRRRL
jgi:hypothetical protein